MRTWIAISCLKVSKWILERFGRGGSLPGVIALRIDPVILSKLTYPKHVVIITGTNGKTTTTNQLYEVMKASGLHTICNLKGDNMKEGIVTTIGANSSLSGNIHADAIVLECDELNVAKVLREMNTSAFIVNNLFRDQGDRLISIDHIVQRIGSCLYDFQGSLILNGNDANVARLALLAPRAKVLYFGVEDNSQNYQQEAKEGKFCPLCQAPLEYEYYLYAHMGRFTCPNHDFGGFAIQALARHIDVTQGTFHIDEDCYHSPQHALYAIYNCAAVVAYCRSIAIPADVIEKTFSQYVLRSGRSETLLVKGKEIELNLMKNPTGANETMKYVASFQEPKNIVIIVNDHEGDGRDVSWYWDADFEMLMKEDVKSIICSGLRANDMALRFIYGGYQGELQVIEEPVKAIETLLIQGNHAFVLANYTALAPTRAILERKGKE